MNWADISNADSDAIIFGQADILLFDFWMSGVHCSCTSCFKCKKIRNLALVIKEPKINFNFKKFASSVPSDLYLQKKSRYLVITWDTELPTEGVL